MDPTFDSENNGKSLINFPSTNNIEFLQNLIDFSDNRKDKLEFQKEVSNINQQNNLLDHSFDINPFFCDSTYQVISNPSLTREVNFNTLLNQDPLDNIDPFLEPSIPLDYNHPSNKLGNNNENKVNLIFKVSDIPYQPTPFSGPETLMYITLHILGNPIKALVNTGAIRSFAGSDGLDLFKKLGLKIDNKNGSGQSCQ